MGFMPFALSLHSLVSSVGADAGFAAIVGLAILVLLYFAHARETDTLREQAGVLSERLQQAEAKLAHLRSGQPVEAPVAGQPEVVPPPGQPAPATAGAQAESRPEPAVAAQAMPAAPAGVGAPALAAATRFVPAAAPAGAPQPPAGPPPSRAPAGAPQRPQPAVAAMGQSAPAAAPAEPRSGAVSAPAPATAAGAANGGRDPGAATPPPRVERPPVGRRPPARPLPRTGGRGRMIPSQPPPKKPSTTAKLVGALVAALVVVGAVAGLLIATSSGGSSQPSAGKAPASNAPSPAPKPAPAAFNPSSVTVAVLNGTATNNLAHTVGSRLMSAGYKQGAVATASDQTRTKTVVAYLPGARNDAQHVATALKLGPSAVAPVDPSTRAIACPPPNSCSAQVIVTVGSDLASL